MSLHMNSVRYRVTLRHTIQVIDYLVSYTRMTAGDILWEEHTHTYCMTYAMNYVYI